MTKMEDAFNLKPLSELEEIQKALAEANKKAEEEAENIENFDEEIHSLTLLALQEINDREKFVAELVDLTEHDKDVDSLYAETIQAFRDTVAIAKDVPAASAGKIYEAAANFAKIALEAKNSKMQARLDSIDLALKKLKITTSAPKDDGEEITSEAIVMDRNELLKSLRESIKAEEKK